MQPLRTAAAAMLPFLPAACSSADPPLRAFLATAAESPQEQPARLWFADGELVALAAATGPGSLTQAARTTLDAIAPGGRVVFSGREWGPRGHGLRIEKVYDDLPGQGAAASAHFRSVLVAADGTVLERTHSVPIADVPRAVLEAALPFGRDVSRAEIVSGPTHEEGWRVTTRTRIGWTVVVHTTLTGRVIGSARLVAAELATG